MSAQQVLPSLYRIPLGIVNAYFLDDADGGILIDTGFPGNADKIVSALREIGKQPADVRHLLLSHTHADHIGSAAALRQASGATTYMHPLDTPITEAGVGFRPMHPAPGLKNRFIAGLVHFRIVVLKMKVDPCPIDRRVKDGEVLPLAGGLTAIHAPGHCLGQLCFLWARHGGVLFAADACAHNKGLDLSIAYEDLAEGKRSLQKLSSFSFEHACFGHGKPILGGADRQFRQAWG